MRILFDFKMKLNEKKCENICACVCVCVCAHASIERSYVVADDSVSRAIESDMLRSKFAKFLQFTAVHYKILIDYHNRNESNCIIHIYDAIAIICVSWKKGQEHHIQLQCSVRWEVYSTVGSVQYSAKCSVRWEVYSTVRSVQYSAKCTPL